MTVIIKEVASNKIDNLINPAMDKFAKSVPSVKVEGYDDYFDVSIGSVQFIVATQETITISFESGEMCILQLPVEYYYKIEVI